jgi:regulatory protein
MRPTRKSTLTLRERALRLLAQREHSQLELRRKLIGRGAAEPVEVDALLAEFLEQGWLSDARFADSRVRTRAGSVSKRYMAAELKQQGVASDVATDALTQLDQDDYETARALWQRKFGTPPANEKEKARQVRFLQARGFGLSLILRLLREQGSKTADDDGQ